MSKLLCPSINCADFDCLKDEIVALDNASCDIFHIDIMDGCYMPSVSLGYNDFCCVRRNTKKLVDVHLYVNNPSPLIRIFASAGADIIYVQADSPVAVASALTEVAEAGKAPGLGINYGTSIEYVEDLLYMVDYVMLVTAPHITPRRFAEQSWEKVEKLLAMRKKTSFKILLDGGISEEVIKKGDACGVDGYVLGTVALFNADKGKYAERIRQLQVL